MALDVLQKFLTARLFDVAGEDTRVDRLRETASDVVEVLKAAPERTAIFTMTAIDGRAGVDDPVVTEVTALLEKRWHSYAGAFSDEKLPTVARSIVLHALAATMGADPVAACVALTARNLLPHLGAQADRELWNDLLANADRRLDLRAQREWALPSAANVPETPLKFDAVPALTPPAVPDDWLKSRFAAAAGPSVASGEALKAPVNSSWPQNGAQWSYEFAPIAGNAVAQALNSVSKALVEAINGQNAASALAEAVQAYVTTAVQSVARTAAGLERRTTLLWWKEALFSPLAKTSYRGLDPAVAAALVAIDGSAQTGAFAPRMAEALVRETSLSIDPAAMREPKPLAELCASANGAAGETGAVIRDYLSQVHVEGGRAPLAGLLGRDEPTDREVLRTRLGLDGSLAVAPADFGVWLFRDLQAAAATPPSPKRKRAARA